MSAQHDVRVAEPDPGRGAEWRWSASRRLPGLPRTYLVLLAGIALLLVGLATLGQRNLPRRGGGLLPALSVHSSDPDGARALFLWLAELGYRAETIEYRPFDVSPEAQVLFVLLPMGDLAEADVFRIVSWMERGGTLVLVVDRPNRLLDRLGVQVGRRDVRLTRTVPRQPVFLRPSLGEVDAPVGAVLQIRAPQWVPILGGPGPEGDVVAVATQWVSGRAFVLTAERPFSNAGLSQADNWALVLHLLATVPAGSTILFDEYHHGLTEHGTLGARLVREPWGWAILYAAGLLFAYAALAGRRFGVAVPGASAGAMRSRVEYVATLAGLLRQGGHREWLRLRFVEQVKRALGSHYRIRTDLPAREFVAVLAAQLPESAALAAPLERLEGNRPADDATILALVREVEMVRARLRGS